MINTKDCSKEESIAIYEHVTNHEDNEEQWWNNVCLQPIVVGHIIYFGTIGTIRARWRILNIQIHDSRNCLRMSLWDSILWRPIFYKKKKEDII